MPTERVTSRLSEKLEPRCWSSSHRQRGRPRVQSSDTVSGSSDDRCVRGRLVGIPSAMAPLCCGSSHRTGLADLLQGRGRIVLTAIMQATVTLTQSIADNRLQLHFNFSQGGLPLSLELPPPVHGQLPHSPLTLVVCQIRFETMAGVGDGKNALRFYEELGGSAGHYLRPEKAELRSIAVELDGQAGAVRTSPTGAQVNGWRLKGREEPWLISLMPDFVSLETTGAYSSWEGFRARLAQVLDASAAALGPETEQRLGLRYVDQINEPEVRRLRDWAQYIDSSLLGMGAHPTLGAGVTRIQQQFELQPNDEFACVVRQGFFSDESRAGNQSFVLDTDVYREGVRLFDQLALLGAADTFHDFALQVFQQSITEKLFNFLRES